MAEYDLIIFCKLIIKCPKYTYYYIYILYIYIYIVIFYIFII